MFKLLKLWLEKCKLKYPTEVQFDKQGEVIDCKGLQLVSGEPYSKKAVYKISDRWRGYDYLGNGLYFCSSLGRFSVSRDVKHPSTVKALRDFNKKFKEVGV